MWDLIEAGDSAALESEARERRELRQEGRARETPILSSAAPARPVDDPVAAWSAAIAGCPYCRGLESEVGSCHYCDGSGDLFGALLADAYSKGFDDGRVGLREALEVLTVASERPGRTVAQLRWGYGL